MKKILILSMSCNNDFFINEEAVVRDTWAKPIIDGEYPHIKYISYRGGYEKNSYSKSEYCLKLNVEDDLQHTFKKTYFAMSMALKNFGDFDYIFRTNTSTYVNVRLLDAFVQALDNDDVTWCGETYSLSEMCSPYPLCLTPRGNCILMSRKMVDVILNNGLSLLYFTDLSDDSYLGNLLNTYWISHSENYRDYVKTFYHGWYKCTNTTVENGHPLCKYNESRQDFNFWKDFITVQIRKYMQDRNEEKDTYYEFDKIMKEGKYEDINESVKANLEYGQNPPVFIGSILGYIPYKQWLAYDKHELYDYEINHKASDDPYRYKEKVPFVYIDYHGNNTKRMLI